MVVGVGDQHLKNHSTKASLESNAGLQWSRFTFGNNKIRSQFLTSKKASMQYPLKHRIILEYSTTSSVQNRSPISSDRSTQVGYSRNFRALAFRGF